MIERIFLSILLLAGIPLIGKALSESFKTKSQINKLRITNKLAYLFFYLIILVNLGLFVLIAFLIYQLLFSIASSTYFMVELMLGLILLNYLILLIRLFSTKKE